MTLIAILIEPDNVAVLTDTLSVGDNHVEWAEMSKVITLPHLDALVTTGGTGSTQERLLIHLNAMQPDLRDFDHLLEVVEHLLPAVWNDQLEYLPEPHEDVWLHLVGWSPAEGRFIGRQYSSEHKFQAVEIGPGKAFTKFPPPSDGPAPRSPEDWVLYADSIRDHWSVQGVRCVKVFIGGDLCLTEMRRGHVSQSRIHRYPADDVKTRRMMIGTLHPFGQLGPCMCGSGQPYTFCHLRFRSLDGPCPCNRFGRPFSECHWVPPVTPEAHEYWRRYVDDFYDTQSELARQYAETYPDEDAALQIPPHPIIPPRPRPVA